MLKVSFSKVPVLSRLISSLTGRWCSTVPFKSKNYWEQRYRNSGNSGSGSYGRLAKFKAEIINQYVLDNNLHKVLEIGCGDGNQLTLAKYPAYMGIDVSKTAIKICRKMFSGDSRKVFHIYRKSGFSALCNDFHPDVVLSLDVIFHLVEDEVFNEYMKNVFGAGADHVILYSDNGEINTKSSHVENRNFTRWVEVNEPEWKLLDIVRNKYPWDLDNQQETSFSDFYFYKRM